MMKYIRYLVYLIRHKYLVLVECWKVGLYWQGIIHDLSKFTPFEFRSYAWNFFRSNGETTHPPDLPVNHFDYAWIHHRHYNQHHWDHFVLDMSKQTAVEMPEKFLKEMVCDWIATGIMKGNPIHDYYKRVKNDIILHPTTRAKLEDILRKMK